jgi:fructose/tagatose bisphosphate aldolase
MQENKSFLDATLKYSKTSKAPEYNEHVNFIFEYMEHGTLADYIKKAGEAMSIPVALRYLHV